MKGVYKQSIKEELSLRGFKFIMNLRTMNTFIVRMEMWLNEKTGQEVYVEITAKGEHRLFSRTTLDCISNNFEDSERFY